MTIAIVSAFILASFSILTYFVSLSIGCSKKSSYFSSAQVMFWFFTIDLSFNVIRAGVASCILVFSLLLFLNGRKKTSLLVGLFAGLFHLTSLPVLGLIVLALIYRKTIFWVIGWALILITQLTGSFDFPLSELVGFLPLASHQVSFLHREADMATNLIFASMLVGFTFVLIHSLFRKGENYNILMLSFFSANILFLIFASMPFSYRFSYYSLLVMPTLTATVFDIFPNYIKTTVCISFLIMTIILNIHMFGFVRDFWI